MVETTNRLINMQHILFVLLFCLFSCIDIRASVVYVSSSVGNDTNTGLEIQFPVKTVKNALGIGDSVMLKSGDVFFESFSLTGKYLSRYGEGPLPKICGYKRVEKEKWVYVGSNIWKIVLTRDNYSGFTFPESSMLNNVGGIHDYDVDSIHGRRVHYKKDLKGNWDMWQTEHVSNKETLSSDFDTLYLYLDKDPNILHLEFSLGTTGVNMINSTIEQVRIEGFGCHGISANTCSSIRDCEIDAIGGMTQIGYQYFVSLGNGIEFYVSNNIEDCLVENCKISRCYDCGVTIQAGRCGQATPRNICVQNNLIYNCCQGWEDFLNNDDNVVYENCKFQNNVILNSGKTAGFNYPRRFKYCHVLGNSRKGNKGMIIKNNLFIGGNYYVGGENSSQFKSNVWINNVCYIKRGDFILSNYLGTKDVIRIPKEKGEFKSLKKATDDAVARYREMTGDKTTKFVIKSDDYLKRKIERTKHKYENRISKL